MDTRKMALNEARGVFMILDKGIEYERFFVVCDDLETIREATGSVKMDEFLGKGQP